MKIQVKIFGQLSRIRQLRLQIMKPLFHPHALIVSRRLRYLLVFARIDVGNWSLTGLFEVDFGGADFHRFGWRNLRQRFAQLLRRGFVCAHNDEIFRVQNFRASLRVVPHAVIPASTRNKIGSVIFRFICTNLKITVLKINDPNINRNRVRPRAL